MKQQRKKLLTQIFTTLYKREPSKAEYEDWDSIWKNAVKKQQESVTIGMTPLEETHDDQSR